jgi:hypothetical protein
MVGPMELIRKNSRKLKRKLSKHDSSLTQVETIPQPNFYKQSKSHSSLNINQTNNISLSSRNNNSVSFDLSAIDREEYFNYSTNNLINDNSLNFQNSTSFYNTNAFHSVQNLSSYTSNTARKSIDHLGDLIEIPKKKNSSPSRRSTLISSSSMNNNSNNNNNNYTNKRKSFDFSTYQYSKSKNKRIFSDSSVYSKSRPTSLILDDSTNIIPSSSTTFYQNKPYSKSTTSLNILDPVMLTIEKKSLELPTIKQNQPLYNISINNIKDKGKIIETKKTYQKSSDFKQKYQHRLSIKHSQMKQKINNHGIVNSDLINYSSTATTLHILFAIIFHIFNIIFSVFIYLPIFLIFKMGHLSMFFLIIGFTLWYNDYWPSHFTIHESTNTLLKIQS